MSKHEIPEELQPCEGEQYVFETWAKSAGFPMDEHPLHYIFMHPETRAAREAWKAAIDYARSVVAGEPKQPLDPFCDDDGGNRMMAAVRERRREAIFKAGVTLT